MQDEMKEGGVVNLIRKTPKKLSTTELTAIITDYNAQREIIARKFNVQNKWLGIITAGLAVLGLIITVIVSVTFGSDFMIYAGTGSFCGVIVFYGWRKAAIFAETNRLQVQLRKLIFPTVFDNIEDFRFEANKKGFADMIPETIMPEYNRSDWGDIVEGAFNGQRFSINEMHLKYRTSGKSSSTTTVFKGVAVRLQRLNNKLPTLTVRNNRMALTKWVSSIAGMGIEDAHIKISDEGIEGQYDIHCRDKNYAEKVFSSDGIRVFKTMIREHAHGKFQFVASRSHIYMLIEQGHNYFELPSINDGLDQVEDIARLRKEMDRFVSLFEQMEKLLNV